MVAIAELQEQELAFSPPEQEHLIE